MHVLEYSSGVSVEVRDALEDVYNLFGVGEPSRVASLTDDTAALDAVLIDSPLALDGDRMPADISGLQSTLGRVIFDLGDRGYNGESTVVYGFCSDAEPWHLRSLSQITAPDDEAVLPGYVIGGNGLPVAYMMNKGSSMLTVRDSDMLNMPAGMLLWMSRSSTPWNVSEKAMTVDESVASDQDVRIIRPSRFLIPFEERGDAEIPVHGVVEHDDGFREAAATMELEELTEIVDSAYERSVD